MRFRLLFAVVLGLALPGLAGCTTSEDPADARGETADAADTGGQPNRCPAERRP